MKRAHKILNFLIIKTNSFGTNFLRALILLLLQLRLTLLRIKKKKQHLFDKTEKYKKNKKYFHIRLYIDISYQSICMK